MMHANEEFKSLSNPLLALDSIHLNIAVTNEHVREIERAIHTIKECNCSTVSGLPFQHYPKLLKLKLISQAVSWMNIVLAVSKCPHTLLCILAIALKKFSWWANCRLSGLIAILLVMPLEFVTDFMVLFLHLALYLNLLHLLEN